MGISLVRAIGLAVMLSCACLSSGGVAAQDSNPATAFKNFVKSEKYNEANFYLSSKLVKPEFINTGQVFADFWFERIVGQNVNIQSAAARIDRLYTYLNAVKPVDLNQRLTCKGTYSSEEYVCLLSNSLLGGAPVSFISYLVERGLDLNRVEEGIVPASLTLVLRLGTSYSLADLNKLTSLGLVLGDETYPLQTLVGYRDSYLRRDELLMPANYLNMDSLNLLDVLVIALGSGIDESDARESVHNETLCSFILYAASSFVPSFDYLIYLLEAKDEFRGGNIGVAKKDSRAIYQPFPTSCVRLVQGMAANHQKLDSVVSKFASEGDVQTAEWLLSLRPGEQN